MPNNHNLDPSKCPPGDLKCLEMNSNHFRVAIFGSARLKPEDKVYQEIYELAKKIGHYNIDLVTGGGPGLMEAASKGHQETSTDESHTLGLTIELPKEQSDNPYIDLKMDFSTFSERLKHFMLFSDVVIVAPGGIGTTLELLFTWQLTQVGHIEKIPIILFGHQWEHLLEWMRHQVLEGGFMDEKDFENIHLAKTQEEVMDIVLKDYKKFEEEFGEEK